MLADRLHQAWPTNAPCLRWVRVLGGQQLAVPPKDGVGRDNRGELAEQASAERRALRGKESSLAVIEPQPALAELLTEHAVLLP